MSICSILKIFNFVVLSFAMLPSICFANDNSEYEVFYHLSKLDTVENNCLDIQGTIKDNSNRQLTIRLAPVIQNLEIKHKGEIVKLEKTEDPYLIKVPNNYKQVDFRYSVCQKNPIRNVNVPIIENKLIYFPTYQLLIYPETDVNKIIKINMDLSSISSNLKVVTSFNVNERKYSLDKSLKEFFNSAICIGDFDIKNITVKNKTIYLVTNGSWAYFQKPSEYYVERILTKLRHFWDDHEFPFYVVFLVKQAEPVPRAALGKHWNNMVAILLPEEANMRTLALHSIAHESFHAWMGKKMKMSLPQGDLQWFWEGFTDYYGLSLAYESNLISIEDYIEIYNAFVKQYWFSPFRTATNEEIRKHYNDGGYYTLIAQLRGHIIAKQLSDKFANNQTNDFDNAMRDLFSQYKFQNKQNVTEEMIDSVFFKHLGREWADTKHIINNGGLLELSKNAFSPFAKLSEVEIDAPDFGFDLYEMLSKHVIANIQSDSEAYIAGLRNGQLLKETDLDFKSVDKVTTVKVDDHGTEKIIKFKPKVVKKKVPQYVMVRGDVFEKRLKNRT